MNDVPKIIRFSSISCENQHENVIELIHALSDHERPSFLIVYTAFFRFSQATTFTILEHRATHTQNKNLSCRFYVSFSSTFKYTVTAQETGLFRKRHIRHLTCIFHVLHLSYKYRLGLLRLETLRLTTYSSCATFLTNIGRERFKVPLFCMRWVSKWGFSTNHFKSSSWFFLGIIFF